jgi:enolase
LDTIKLSVENAGYTLVMKLWSLDCAAAEFYVNGKYDILNLKEKG